MGEGEGEGEWEGGEEGEGGKEGGEEGEKLLTEGIKGRRRERGGFRKSVVGLRKGMKCAGKHKKRHPEQQGGRKKKREGESEWPWGIVRRAECGSGGNKGMILKSIITQG